MAGSTTGLRLILLLEPFDQIGARRYDGAGRGLTGEGASSGMGSSGLGLEALAGRGGRVLPGRRLGNLRSTGTGGASGGGAGPGSHAHT